MKITEDTALKNFGATEEEEERFCRNCHSTRGKDFIAPCNCTGSIKWVHRSCLNEWRAVSPNPRSFTHCDICNFEYQLTFKEKGRYLAEAMFAFRITRDFSIVFAISQIIVVLCALFIWGVDMDRERDKLFDDIGWTNAPHLFIDYVFGWLLFFFIMGIIGIFTGLIWLCGGCSTSCCGSSEVTYDTYNYGFFGYYFYFFYFPSPSYHYHAHHSTWCGGYGSTGGGCSDCNCGSSDCDCGGDGGEGLAVVLIVLVIIVIVCGIIFSAILAAIVGYLIISRHLTVLRRRHKAGRWEIADLSTRMEV